jgi:hypothetical protein
MRGTAPCGITDVNVYSIGEVVIENQRVVVVAVVIRLGLLCSALQPIESRLLLGPVEKVDVGNVPLQA